ncbi:MAG TPA: tetratricopeptide repeat protein, partial [Terriglobales bacterium]
MIPRLLLLATAVALTAALILAAEPQVKTKPADKPAEAARLNNLGAAYMNQQLFEKGLKAFQEASALDPKLFVARMNQGIALVNLGRVDEAKTILEDAAKREPKNPHAWYNLGLLYKNSTDPQASADAFRRVTEIDANDADTWYFLGSAYAQAKQFPQAIDAFQHALKINPLHASAEFGLSRAYQQSGDVPTAREHLQRFQHITQNKLGSPISLAYGEQGQYSRVEESPAAVEKVAAAIPVKFVDVTSSAGLWTMRGSLASNDPDVEFLAHFGPGACFLD